MNFKTIGLTTAVRVVASIAVVGGATLLTTGALAQGEAPAPGTVETQAEALSILIADAAQKAAVDNPNATPEQLAEAVEDAILAVLSAANPSPAVAQLAMSKAQALIAQMPQATALARIVSVIANVVTETAQTAQNTTPGTQGEAGETAQTVTLASGRRLTIALPSATAPNVVIYVSQA